MRQALYASNGPLAHLLYFSSSGVEVCLIDKPMDAWLTLNHTQAGKAVLIRNSQISFKMVYTEFVQGTAVGLMRVWNNARQVGRELHIHHKTVTVVVEMERRRRVSTSPRIRSPKEDHACH